MKVIRKEKAFEPFDFTIRIECEDDLLTLWHYLNRNFNEIRAIPSDRYRFDFGDANAHGVCAHIIWEFLNEKVKELNLRDRL